MKYDLKYTDEWNRKQLEHECTIKYYKDKNLTIAKVDGGIILPTKSIEKDFKTRIFLNGGGVLDKNKKYLEISSQKLARGKFNQCYEFDETKLKFFNKRVVYMGVYTNAWGHLLCECISRLWYVLQSEPTAFIAYIGETSSTPHIKGKNLEFMELLGLKLEQFILVDKPMQFEQVIIPELSCINGPLNEKKYYTKEYRYVFEHIKKNIEAKYNSKIYFTRTALTEKKEIGEKIIEKFFENNGYKIISPEKYSVKEQIAYFKGAKEIVAIQGTLPHNILFAEDGIEIIIINKLYRTNPFQSLINYLRNANVTYIDAYWMLFPTGNGYGPFVLMFNENFQRFANDMKMMEKPSKNNTNMGVTQLLWYLLSFISKNENLAIFSKKELEEISDIYSFFRKQLSKQELEVLNDMTALLFERLANTHYSL